MKSPFTGKEMVLVKEIGNLSFRKEEYEIIQHFYKCVDTEETFTTTELDNLNLSQLYNKYREAHCLPFPDEIKSIRLRYGLSAIKMSEVLGFGVNSYRNYEAGEIPSNSNANLIQSVTNPIEFKNLVERSNVFNEKPLSTLIHKINSIILEQKSNKYNYYLENYFLGESKPNSYTGYITPNFKKLSEMIVYFAGKLEPYKTKLNKLLFYTDFIMYNRHGISISGAKYRAISMGPVPNNFQSIYEYLAKNDYIDLYYVTFPEGYSGEILKSNPKKEFNSDIFSEQEVLILEEVYNRFRDVSTKDIIEISHKEEAWLNNKDGNNIINYRNAFYLNN